MPPRPLAAANRDARVMAVPGWQERINRLIGVSTFSLMFNSHSESLTSLHSSKLPEEEDDSSSFLTYFDF